MSEKLKLGENHRRVISVVFRGIEQACDEIDATFRESQGALRHVADDLSSKQVSALLEMTGRVRGEIHRLATEIELDISIRSQRRTIVALLSSCIVNLEESEPKKLRGYGPMSTEAEARLGTEFRRLIDVLERMAAIVEER